ncbi:MAG: glycerophosphodiester phosphodiesterase family protein [Acidobacteriota bacterium]
MDEFFALRRPRVLAHRGDSETAPENTLAALRQALAAGADLIEIDVTFSRDRKIVVIHDETVDRTTDGAGAVLDLDLAALRALDAGAWKGERFVGERIPTLDDVLAWARERILINVEIKSEAVEVAHGGASIASEVAQRIAEHGMADRTILSSFDPRPLAWLRDHRPDLTTAALERPRLDRNRSPAEIVGSVGASGFNTRRDAVHRARIEAAHAADLLVSIYTVNDVADMERVLDLGVDALFTDAPGRLVELLRQHPGRWRRPARTRRRR